MSAPGVWSVVHFKAETSPNSLPNFGQLRRTLYELESEMAKVAEHWTNSDRSGPNSPNIDQTRIMIFRFRPNLAQIWRSSLGFARKLVSCARVLSRYPMSRVQSQLGTLNFGSLGKACACGSYSRPHASLERRFWADVGRSWSILARIDRCWTTPANAGAKSSKVRPSWPISPRIRRSSRLRTVMEGGDFESVKNGLRAPPLRPTGLLHERAQSV